jgi:glycosyltransferase involved in cell wall biosynthesis
VSGLSVTILAHNEERRISACLASIVAEPGDFPIHVVVNGSTDRTATLAATFGARVTVHSYAEPGKSRSWNRFVMVEQVTKAQTEIFVDGDAVVAPGSFAALADAQASNEKANAAAGQPLNGRSVALYRREQSASHGLFGDLYAIRGRFLERMKASHIRLPDDLIGDDSLIGALAKIDLDWGGEWRNERVVVVPEAGFHAEPFNPLSLRGLRQQYRRMINYSVRHFQNQIIGQLMRDPAHPPLPARMADLYPHHLPEFAPRRSPSLWWFDRQALARMRRAINSTT